MLRNIFIYYMCYMAGLRKKVRLGSRISRVWVQVKNRPISDVTSQIVNFKLEGAGFPQNNVGN